MSRTTPDQGHLQETSRVYMRSLDGLRFVAFLLVLLSHSGAVVSRDWPLTYALHLRGWVGVELFFVISSFLFFTLFQVEYQRTGRIVVGNFFIRRLLRIYPLMVITPLLFMLLNYRTLNTESAWLQLRGIALFADNLLWLPSFRREIPWAEHLWTLSFEFQVYLMLPVIFTACIKLGRARALWLLLGIWIACLGLRAHYALGMTPHPFIYFTPWLRPDSIILGMALALVAPIFRNGASFAAMALVAGLAAFFTVPNVNVAGASNIVLYPSAAVVCGAMLWLALRSNWIRAFLGSAPMVYLGKRTFGIYVFHVAVLTLMVDQLVPKVLLLTGSHGVSYIALVVSTATVSIGAAIVSYQYFERPFLLLKDKRAAVLTRPI